LGFGESRFEYFCDGGGRSGNGSVWLLKALEEVCATGCGESVNGHCGSGEQGYDFFFSKHIGRWKKFFSVIRKILDRHSRRALAEPFGARIPFGRLPAVWL